MTTGSGTAFQVLICSHTLRVSVPADRKPQGGPEIAEHVAKRKELWEARKAAEENNSGSTCATIPERGPGMPEGFASETAKASGQRKASVNRAVKRGIVAAFDEKHPEHSPPSWHTLRPDNTHGGIPCWH
jgi:hypothetical protein